MATVKKMKLCARYFRKNLSQRPRRSSRPRASCSRKFHSLRTSPGRPGANGASRREQGGLPSARGTLRPRPPWTRALSPPAHLDPPRNNQDVGSFWLLHAEKETSTLWCGRMKLVVILISGFHSLSSIGIIQRLSEK
nr:uncharacterized protein LOC131273234 isoform X2 [Dasypus novemcinctus]